MSTSLMEPIAHPDVGAPAAATDDGFYVDERFDAMTSQIGPLTTAAQLAEDDDDLYGPI